MHEVTLFNYHNNEMRTIITENGEPWFVAKDVCNILKLENVTNAVRGLDTDDLTLRSIRSGGQDREMNMVSEPGLFHLIFKSQTEAAKAFKRWVTHEVLPSIRKTGGYLMPGTDQSLVTAVEARVLVMVERTMTRMSEELVSTVDERLRVLQFNQWVGSPVAHFLERYCDVGCFHAVAKKDLYKFYLHYCQVKGWHADCKAHFFKHLYHTVQESLAITQSINGVRTYLVRGLALKPEAQIILNEDRRDAEKRKVELRKMVLESQLALKRELVEIRADNKAFEREIAEESALLDGGTDQEVH